jgi:hypothetical protein
LLAFLLLLPSYAICQEVNKEKEKVAFSPLEWKTDTLGKNGYRARMKGKIGNVVGKTVNELKALLGEPDRLYQQDGETYFEYYFEYFISPNFGKKTATQSKIELQNGTSDAHLGSLLIFTFGKDGKLSDARLLWQCG